MSSHETAPTPSSTPEPWQILDDLYERALTRFLASSGFDYRDYLDEEELTEFAAAERAERAQTESPRASTAPEHVGEHAGRVVIEVLGGVAEVTSKPDDIDVEIIDHDNAGDEVNDL